MTSSFVHLSIHSEYSLCEGIVRIKPLLKAASAKGFKALALTDVMNLFAAVKFYKAAIAEGIKPIIGAEIWLRNRKSLDKPYKMTLLCQNNEGYLKLTELISKAYLEGQRHNGIPLVEKSWLRQYRDGIIALSGAKAGEVGLALINNHPEDAKNLAKELAEIYPNAFYLQVENFYQGIDATYAKRVSELAKALLLPLIATNTVCFLEPDDFEAHLARVCISEGETLEEGEKHQRHSEEQYLKDASEMQELMAELSQDAIINTVEVSKRCSVFLELGKAYLPDFPIPQGDTTASYLEKVSKEGLDKRLTILLNDGLSAGNHNREDYEERLQVELDVINNMGFPGYFLIVADFIQWSKAHGIPVGPGRGSGAGSLVAYALGITDLDPLQYELLFERFLNPERVSMPDFDVDFCMDGRDKVIEYVADKYGRESVSQIITFGRMAAKAVVRDVGRVLAHPYGFVDRIAKLIPFELGITLQKALDDTPELKQLYDDDLEVKGIIDLALKLEGITRNAGKHAGGVVIAPSKLTNFSAVFCEEGKTQIVSQFDKDDVEAAGLVKFDFLGLRTLTIIDWAVQNVKAQCGEKLAIDLIPTDDKDTFKLLKDCLTTAVFQLESRGMKELIGRLQPDCFEEIIALVALFRPGPLQSGMVDDFIDRKHGRAKVVYPHPELEPILKPTYGVILYQEQVMQIAQVLAGYSLGAADLLRRAMGKKKPEEMAKQREIFVSGATARNVDSDVASGIFDLMEKFAGYGFNKSHSAAYALVSYQTAWLKTHYKEAFMAAVLSSDMDNTDKVVIFLEECEALRIKVRLPSVNEGENKFSVLANGEIVYGLGAIKGLGEGVIQLMVDARNEGGPFKSLFDLCQRVSVRKLNKRALEALIKSGALDCLLETRATLYASIEKVIKAAQQEQKSSESGQMNLFSMASNVEVIYEKQDEWPLITKLNFEKECLGLFLSSHPIKDYKKDRESILKTRLRNLTLSQKKTEVLVLISAIRRIKTKTDKIFHVLTLDDNTTKMEALVFEKVFNQYEDLIKKDEVVVVSASLSEDRFTGGIRMLVDKITTVAEARAQRLKGLSLDFHSDKKEKIDEVMNLILSHNGHCPITFCYQDKIGSVKIKASDKYKVHPSNAFLFSLQKILGENAVSFKT